MDKVLTEFIPNLIQNGIFGNVKFVSASSENLSLAPQFQSVIDFVKIVTADKKNPSEKKELSVVVKIQQNISHNYPRDISQLFKNEVIMYNDILPFIGAEAINVSPKCYYAYSSGGENLDKDIVILGNLNKQGFIVCKHKWIMDIDHILLSVRKLAEFHALSYAKKHKDKDTFLNKAIKLKNAAFNPEFPFDKFVSVTMGRGISNIVSKKPQYKEVLEKFFNSAKNLYIFYEILLKSEEPFSVICHGDFLKNNIFYSYDDSSNVTDCRFFDFQFSLYTSPTIDLSVFLYMHTTKEIRSHWNEILRVYWNTVREKVPSHIPLSSFDEFLQHFSERAVFAYAPCSFFLPLMIADERPPSMDTFINLDFEEQEKLLKQAGGELGTQLISDIVLHLLEEKYIYKFLDLIKTA